MSKKEGIMKCKNSVFFIVLVITLFLFPVCKSEPVEENMEQEKEVTQEASPWKIARGVEVDRNTILAEFDKLKEAVVMAFNNRNFEEVGALFEKKGAILCSDPDCILCISGKTEIAALFAENEGKELTIDKPKSVHVGMIQKTVWGEWAEKPGVERPEPINKFARIHFELRFEIKQGGRTLQNKTYYGEGTFLHRHGCPWDG
jgi:hypothetical protein